MSVNIVNPHLANKRNISTTVETSAPTFREHLAAADASEIEYQALIQQFADRRAVARKRVAR